MEKELGIDMFPCEWSWKLKEGEKAAFFSVGNSPSEIIPPRDCMEAEGRHEYSTEGARKAEPYLPQENSANHFRATYHSLSKNRQRQSKAEQELKQTEIKNKNRKPVMKPTPLPPCPVLPSYPNTRKLDPGKGEEEEQILRLYFPCYLKHKSRQ